MGYQIRAARLGVDLNSLTVEIEADFDVAGMLSMESTARPGYSEVRYHVSVESSAPEADILRVLDEGDVLSPYRDVFSARNVDEANRLDPVAHGLKWNRSCNAVSNGTAGTALRPSTRPFGASSFAQRTRS